MTETPASRRPPPPPPHIPRPAPRPTTAPAAVTPPPAPMPEPPLIVAGRSRATESAPARPQRVPTLLRDSQRFHPSVFGEVETPQEGQVRRHFAWIAVAGWAWIMVILLLVVGPLDAVPKLIGPFRQPISAGAYGPLVAIFAMGAVLVAMSGFFWLWVILTRNSQEDRPAPPPPEAPPPL